MAWRDAVRRKTLLVAAVGKAGEGEASAETAVVVAGTGVPSEGGRWTLPL